MEDFIKPDDTLSMSGDGASPTPGDSDVIHRDTLVSLMGLAVALGNQGRHVEAQGLYREVLVSRSRNHMFREQVKDKQAQFVDAAMSLTSRSREVAEV